MKIKSLFSNEYSSSSNEADDSDDDSRNVLFMELEEIDVDDKEDYVKGDVNLEVELINALSEPNKERKKNKYSKGSWMK